MEMKWNEMKRKKRKEKIVWFDFACELQIHIFPSWWMYANILFRTYNFCVYAIAKAPADIHFGALQKGIRAFKEYKN